MNIGRVSMHATLDSMRVSEFRLLLNAALARSDNVGMNILKTNIAYYIMDSTEEREMEVGAHIAHLVMTELTKETHGSLDSPTIEEEW